MPPRPPFTPHPVYLRRTHTPIGRIEVGSDGAAITSLSIERSGTLPYDGRRESTTAVLDTAITQLEEYFLGRRRRFEVPVSTAGTDFQSAVWAGLQDLAWGEVASYGSLGLATGRATAGRAVGGAVGANPIPLLIPCHRVLAGDRRITGYSAGNGVATKLWLLEHEGIEHR